MAALVLMQLAVYPSIRSQGPKMRELISSYPSAFKAMFGMQGVDFTSGPGYLSTEAFSLLILWVPEIVSPAPDLRFLHPD
jgi:ABC-2 type transport system permease protein